MAHSGISQSQLNGYSDDEGSDRASHICKQVAVNIALLVDVVLTDPKVISVSTLRDATIHECYQVVQKQAHFTAQPMFLRQAFKPLGAIRAYSTPAG